MAKNLDPKIKALNLLRDNSMALSHELSDGASNAIEEETLAAYTLLLAALPVNKEDLMSENLESPADALSTLLYYASNWVAEQNGGAWNGDAQRVTADIRTAEAALTQAIAKWDSVEMEGGVRLVPADAIVIERSELPEVTVDRMSIMVSGVRHSLKMTSAEIRSAALDFLAVAEWRDVHPPVDEEMVATLTAVLIAAEDPNFQTDLAYARRLYLAGVRIEKEN